jgi:hypothetical protein
MKSAILFEGDDIKFTRVVNVFGAAATDRALPGRLSKVRKIQLAKRHRKCGLARAKKPVLSSCNEVLTFNEANSCR